MRRAVLLLAVKLSARTDGSFTVAHERTGYMKEIPATRRTTSATR
jgi:hypothetical protein